ncbi:MAG TPA: NUDIX hydrolase [Candidatus Nitrosotalea sp.]|nr:NUDIX hydrolase [Candidatus Nitrosotalea sp.]
MRKKIFQGRVLSLNVYKVSLRGRKVTREVIEHPGAAAMLAIEKGKLLLVKQHRFPHGFVLEIPAGTLNKGESPKRCAFRELKEETGYEAKKMTPLIKYYPSIGYNTEIIHCFVASGIKKISGLKLDEDEIISVVKIDFKKVLRMVLSGKIEDSKTICAVLTYAMKEKIYV